MNTDKKLIAFAIYACSFMSAIEITIVTTAIPAIVRDLNGFNLSSYLFSIYLLTSAVSTAVFGKLSDVYGRKKLFQLSILLFLVGSVLCGLSQSMIFLIISRGVQGMGSGAINTLSMATIGDVFEVSERTKIQGYNSTLWSVGSLIAPFISGLMLIKLTWHWIFFINVPIALLSLYLINRSYKVKEQSKPQKLDSKGLSLLTIFIICLLQILSMLEKHPIYDLSVIFLIVVAIISMMSFINVEKKVEEPVLPFRLFTKEVLIIIILSFLNSMVLIAMDVYNPSFMQNVGQYSPIMSTTTIVPMSFFWVIGSVLLARVISKYSLKHILIVSFALLDIGLLGLIFLKPNINLALMVLFSSFIGLGFGGSFNTLLFVVQESLSKDDIGIASGSVMFIRTLGQTIGISFFGTVLNSSIVKYFDNSNISVDINSILTDKTIPINDKLTSLFIGHNNIFITCFIIGFACIIITMFLQANKKISDWEIK